jgi:2-methylcitrate dehydratase PrpD
MESSEGLSARIADHVACCPADALSAATIHAAKRALLDGVGVMLAASGLSPDVVPFVEQARGATGPATVLGHGFTSTPMLAALANGAMAHALDYEDAFDAAPSHPNASLLPAVLATAQAVGGVSGRELLAAIAIGCDLVCRLGLSLRRPMEDGGWYPPPMLGAFGAVAAAGRLQRLSAEQMLDAFSLMLCQMGGPGEIKYSRDTVIRAIREAFPAQSAVQLAALAKAGIRGFDAPFEGRAGFFRLYAQKEYDPGAILDGLGAHFWIEQLSFKQWPACRGTHAYIEAVQTLRRRYAIDPDSIVGILAVGGAVQRMLVEPADRKSAPSVAIDAKFSIPFTIAAALTEDEVTLDSFASARLADPRTRALAALVAYEQHPDWGHAQAASGVLTIRTADGRCFSESVEVALGHPDRPLSDAALRAKFIACAAQANQSISLINSGKLADSILAIDALADSMTLFKKL